LTASAPVSHVYAGEAVTFSYVVTNQGGVGAANLHLDVTIPKPYYLYQDPSGGLMAGTVLQVQVPNLAPGQSVTVKVGLRVDANYKDEEQITFPAELTYDQGPMTGLTAEGPLVMPTGQLKTGDLFIDVNEMKPGETANITLVPGLRGYIRLKIYNSAGELVKTLEAQYPATEKEVIKRSWDGKNMNGEFVSSGVYVVCATMPGIAKTGRIVVIR
jgi:hypothetical protein